VIVRRGIRACPLDRWVGGKHLTSGMVPASANDDCSATRRDR
jgi:hypothetical protein